MTGCAGIFPVLRFSAYALQMTTFSVLPDMMHAVSGIHDKTSIWLLFLWQRTVDSASTAIDDR